MKRLTVLALAGTLLAPTAASALPPDPLRDMCNGVFVAATNTLDHASHIYNLLDMASGGKTPTTPQLLSQFRDQLAKAAPACDTAPERAAACVKGPTRSSSDTNRTYTAADVCAATADIDATVAAAARRGAEYAKITAPSDKPDIREGWIPSLAPVAYATYFQPDPKQVARATDKATALYEAAGIPVPEDLSWLWADNAAWWAEYKKVVDDGIDTWKLVPTNCSGYYCAVAKKAVMKQHPKARVVAVRSDNDWNVIEHKTTGAPLRRIVNTFVAYQMPGEPACQVRSVDIVEQHKGAGRYTPARAGKVGYVRFQRCP
jgi:hypothetical protein